MIRDQGPKYNIGFGVPPMDAGEEEGYGGEGLIARKMGDHPILKYLGTAAASIVSMGLAGAVVRKGGLRALEKVQSSAITNPAMAGRVRSFRRVEEYLDDLEGVTRTFQDDNELNLVKRVGSKIERADNKYISDGYAFRGADNKNLNEWSYRREIQQRMVRQARRLPYEIPGFYAADKLVLDPLLGTDANERPTNWSSPVDVVGDFASESIKNIAFNVLPFDVGAGAAIQKYRGLSMVLRNNPGNSPGVASTRYMLEQLGASATDIMHRTMKLGHQSMGTFSQLVDDSVYHRKTYEQVVRQASTQITHSKAKPIGNSNYGQRMWQRSKDIFGNRDLRQSALDAMPGPFKGMATGVQHVKHNWKKTGQTYDDWQDVISGRIRMDSLIPGTERYNELTAFMSKGGGTYIEKMARDTAATGPITATKGGKITPDFFGSEFYKTGRDQAYKQTLVDTLIERGGLRPEAAVEFINKAQKVSAPATRKGSQASLFGKGLIDRIQFGKDPYLGPAPKGDNTGWWDDLVGKAGAQGKTAETPHGLFTAASGGLPVTKRDFESAVSLADMRFSSKDYKRHLDRMLSTQWNTAQGSIIPEQATSGLKLMAQPYERFQGSALQANKDYLIKRNAQLLDVPLLSGGVARPLSQVEDELRNKGVDPGNLHFLRGRLIEKKDIAKPWTTNGRNLFGFRPLSLAQAVNQGFYSANDAGTQKQLDSFIDYKATNAIEARAGITSDSAWRLKTGGAYTSADGRVLDFGRIGRSFRGFVDTLGEETKVPILGFNPLQMGGLRSFQAQRRSRSIKVISPLSRQPFLQPGEAPPSQPLLWMREGRGNRGRVAQLPGMGQTEGNLYPGLYRSLQTVGEGMDSRYGKIWLGDTGIPSSAADIEGGWRGKLRKNLDVSYDQEGSTLFGKQSLIKRWLKGRRGPESYSNPQRMAGQLSKGMPADFTPEMARGMEGLVSLERNFSFPRAVLEALPSDPRFKGVFDPVGKQNLFDIPEQALPSIVKQVLEADEQVFRGLRGSSRTEARKLGQQLRNLTRQGDEQHDFWNLATSDGAKSVGVNRRIDQLKGQLADYLLASAPIRAQATGAKATPFSVGTLFSKLDEMFANGQISRAERVEGRAAVLSLETENIRNRHFAKLMQEMEDAPLYELNKRTAESLAGSGTEMRNVLREISQFKQGTEGGTRGWLRSTLREEFATTPYVNKNATNPVGDNFLLVPTIGTVASRQGGRRPGWLNAARGMGTTWNDPNAISAASAIPTHMAMRLNTYLETFGVGLDPTRYKGPIDYYARGLIGRRVAPAFIAGTTAVGIDRTMGGMVYEDDAGDPIYRPLVLGGVASAIASTQVGMAGLIPGGQTADEKSEELYRGEVPIRQGRYWLLGNQPFKGGRIQYFRPSWYQRFMSGGAYAPEMNETPMERMMFGQDFSPLRPLDPYRREREDAQSRPYPVSGDYFTGPWGALNPVLNATIGRVLKPQRELNAGATELALEQYAPVGEGGAFLAGGMNVNPTALANASSLNGYNESLMLAADNPGTPSSSVLYPSMGYSAPRGFASMEVRNRATAIATTYSQRAQTPGAYVGIYDILAPYGVPVADGYMSPRIIAAGQPLTENDPTMRMRQLGYRTQETLGIYGFGAGLLRSSMGFGSQDFTPDRAVLEPSSRGYSSARSFWNMNIGGLGDLPLPLESRYSNFELSEIVRRFVPKDPQGITYVNDLPNEMGQMYPWLPGADYPLASIKTGDPYTAVPDAEIRLPGTGYARTHQLFPDRYGQLGLANIHDILGDVAPWSDEFDTVDTMVNSSPMDLMAKAKVSQTRAQVEAMRIKNEFTPYDYKYSSPLEMAKDPAEFSLGKGWEWLSHRDTFLNSKFLPTRTALEDWERENVYGSTFPSWSSPIEGYVEPFINKSTQRDPFSAASAGGVFGALFGASRRAKVLGGIVGGTTGLIASTFGNAYEAATGERYIPEDRKKQVALEEYCLPDITKVLTKRGWITCYELTLDDDIMTFNPETEQAEWQKPTKISMFDGVREMEYWKNRSIEVMSTLTHRWMVRGSTSKKIGFKTTETITNTNPVVIGGGDFSSIGVSTEYFDNEFVELMAWVMTEGYLRKDYAIEISQKGCSPWVPDIEKVVDWCRLKGIKVSRYLNKEQFIYYFPRKVSDEVRQWINPKTKAIHPEFFGLLTHKQLLIFYETCIKADGWQTGNSDYFGQKEMDRVENFQMVAAMLGYRTNVYSISEDWFDVGVQKRFNTLQFHRSESTIREKVTFEGVVWCPTTPNATWMANYNGSVFWTGNTDILKYTKSAFNAQRAANMGNQELAQQFVEESKETMYGADLNSTPEQVAMAVPDRKRQHFKAMLYAPEQEREQILSTAGRLERRLYQAAWGMEVEGRPDLTEYFEDHELPTPESSFWNPLTDTEQVKIKVGQHLGLDMAQMGYYPQQVKEANLVNPSYPNMFQGTQMSLISRMRGLLNSIGANGSVTATPNTFGEDRVQLTAGMY